MKFLLTLKKQIERFFLFEANAKPIAVLRIVIGCGLLVEALSVYPYLEDLYGQYGILQSDLIEHLTGAAIPGFFAKMGVGAATFSWGFSIFYCFHILFASLFVIGLGTRFAGIALFVSQSILLNSGYLSNYGVDRYFQNLLFLLIWMPVAEEYSFDRRMFTPRAPLSASVSLRLLQIYLLLTYVSAGFGKSLGSDWWTGESIWRVLNQPEFHRYDFFWLANHYWIVKALSWGTIFIELFYIVGAFLPRVGKAWVWSIIAMHLGIAFVMNLTLFGITMAMINLALFLVPARKKRIQSKFQATEPVWEQQPVAAV